MKIRLIYFLIPCLFFLKGYSFVSGVTHKESVKRELACTVITGNKGDFILNNPEEETVQSTLLNEDDENDDESFHVKKRSNTTASFSYCDILHYCCNVSAARQLFSLQFPGSSLLYIFLCVIRI